MVPPPRLPILAALRLLADPPHKGEGGPHRHVGGGGSIGGTIPVGWLPRHGWSLVSARSVDGFVPPPARVIRRRDLDSCDKHRNDGFHGPVHASRQRWR